MYSFCKNAWHLIDKILSWIYLIKFLEVCLRYLSDLHSYRKYQNYVYGKREHSGAMGKKYDLRSIRPSASCAKKQHINHLHELLESNKACILIIIIIYHSVWSFNITFNIVIAVIIIIVIIIIIIIIIVVVVVIIIIIIADWKYVSNCS